MSVYNLNRFIDAQALQYEDAISEIENGLKVSQWMWFIFPQLKGLGKSETANYYGIEDINEAREYLAHPILGNRLIESTVAILSLNENDPTVILGDVDALKLRSSMTLFAQVSENPIFKQVIDKYFNGKMDETTLSLLRNKQ